MFYRYLIKPILFLFDPERMHDFFISFGEFLGRNSLGRALVRSLCYYGHPTLRQSVRGVDFPNPVGLAAGFDKDARLTEIIPEVGFGFMEAGSVTYHPYGGNPGKHLVRLPKDRSLVVYYGLKSAGARAIFEKVKNAAFRIPVGLSIAKTNRADIKGEKSVEDYVATYKLLAARFSYVTLNISCPNAQDGCTFQDPEFLERLLKAIRKEKKHAPVFLKISNHLSYAEIDAILDVAGKYGVIDGFVVANLSKRRDLLVLRSPKELLNIIPEGGISGAPIKKKASDIIRYIYKRTNGKYAIIGVGGISSAEDAYEKIKAGASLLQLITGMIYEGPGLIKKINKGLVGLLAKDGFGNIREAVGTGSS